MCQSQIARNEWVYHFIAQIQRQHLFSWTAYRLGNFRLFIGARVRVDKNKFILKWIGNLFAFAPFSHYHLRNTMPPIRYICVYISMPHPIWQPGGRRRGITTTNIDLSAMVYLCGSVCCGCRHRQNFCRFLYFSFDFIARTFWYSSRFFGELGCVASRYLRLTSVCDVRGHANHVHVSRFTTKNTTN